MSHKLLFFFFFKDISSSNHRKVPIPLKHTAIRIDAHFQTLLDCRLPVLLFSGGDWSDVNSASLQEDMLRPNVCDDDDGDSMMGLSAPV